MTKGKQLRLDGMVWEEAFEPQYPQEYPPLYLEEEDWDEESKICENCCYFVRCMDDLYRHRGVCAFSTNVREHDEDMECYYPEKYERCFW